MQQNNFWVDSRDPFHDGFKAFMVVSQFSSFQFVKTVKTNTSHQISLKTKVTLRKIFKEES